MITELPIVFGTKPYSGPNAKPLPAYVQKLPAKKRRQWRHVWESAMAKHGDESRAFAEANAVAGR